MINDHEFNICSLQFDIYTHILDQSIIESLVLDLIIFRWRHPKQHTRLLNFEKREVTRVYDFMLWHVHFSIFAFIMPCTNLLNTSRITKKEHSDLYHFSNLYIPISCLDLFSGSAAWNLKQDILLFFWNFKNKTFLIVACLLSLSS